VTIVYAMASTTLIVTPLILLLLLFGPLLDKKFAAKSRRILWIAVMIGLCFPALLHEQAAQAGVRHPVRPVRCDFVQSPMLFGLIRPIILLPGLCRMGELPFILRHELIHYGRSDLWYKLTLILTKSAYWFNPAVHLMAAQAYKDVEIVCDTLTVRGMNATQRRKYGEMILHIAASPRTRGSRLASLLRERKEYAQAAHRQYFLRGQKTRYGTVRGSRRRDFNYRIPDRPQLRPEAASDRR